MNVDLLRPIRAVFFDMDGVVYLGNTLLPGVQELIDYLDATGRSYLFVTNFSGRTSREFDERLASFGLKVPAGKVLGSGQVTARYLLDTAGPGAKILVVGEPGLHATMKESGFEICTEPEGVEYVVAGFDSKINYEKLTVATRALLGGAKLIGTNGDPILPTDHGSFPGGGAVIAFLAYASGQTPPIVGKPHAPMFEKAFSIVGSKPNETLMIGDRYDSDIEGAIALNMPTIGVLTGVSTREHFESRPKPPTMIMENLVEVLAAFKSADGKK